MGLYTCIWYWARRGFQDILVYFSVLLRPYFRVIKFRQSVCLTVVKFLYLKICLWFQYEVYFSKEVTRYAAIFLKVGCASRKFHIVHIYHLFLFKSFLIYIVHIVHSNLQYRRKMHLKCSCLWIYRDGIWMNQRQWLDNCRGYQILHWQDNRLLAIVRRTKMMTSYRQIPVPSNKVIH